MVVRRSYNSRVFVARRSTQRRAAPSHSRRANRLTCSARGRIAPLVSSVSSRAAARRTLQSALRACTGPLRDTFESTQSFRTVSGGSTSSLRGVSAVIKRSRPSLRRPVIGVSVASGPFTSMSSRWACGAQAVV